MWPNICAHILFWPRNDLHFGSHNYIKYNSCRQVWQAHAPKGLSNEFEWPIKQNLHCIHWLNVEVTLYMKHELYWWWYIKRILYWVLWYFWHNQHDPMGFISSNWKQLLSPFHVLEFLCSYQLQWWGNVRIFQSQILTIHSLNRLLHLLPITKKVGIKPCYFAQLY